MDELENIMLSEISQLQNKYCMISLIWGILHSQDDRTKEQKGGGQGLRMRGIKNCALMVEFQFHNTKFYRSRSYPKGECSWKERITKWQEETFAGDKYIHYLGCSDDFLSICYVCMCVFIFINLSYYTL